MPKIHEVRQGDCISSIARRYGIPPVSIWNDSRNADLQALRKNPNVLFPGDIVHLPDEPETFATGTRHRFRLVQEVLRIRLLDEFDEPRANLPYQLDIDGDLRSGTTNDHGELMETIPPDAREGRLSVGDPAETFTLALGYLDPITEVSGVQARLANLGFDCGPPDGILGPRTRSAIAEFQARCDLEPTGEIGGVTSDKLAEIHGV